MTSVRSIATSEGGRIWRVRRRAKELRLPWIPIMIMTILVVSATFAPVLSPHDPTGIDLRNAKMAPGKTWSHSLGTDVLGRDMLSRLIYGARTAVFISVVALGTGAVVGTSLGLISGYAGGAIDALIMRATDAALGFPTILLAMILVTVLGEGIQNIIIAVALTVWANFVRMIRGDVLSVKEMDFVTMSRIAGHSPLEITRRHIFPNVVNTLMVITSLLVGQVILLEAAAELPRPGPASRSSRLGHDGGGGTCRDPRSVVAIAVPRCRDHSRCVSVQLLRRLATGHTRSQAKPHIEVLFWQMRSFFR